MVPAIYTYKTIKDDVRYSTTLAHIGRHESCARAKQTRL